MTKPCSTPGCQTLTYGEVCLRCLQRQARERQQGVDFVEAQRGDPVSTEST
jgi:hypothetical protein